MLARFEKPFIFIVGLILLLSCFIQIAYRYKITPPDREYLGYHEFYTDDYSIYLSNIFQGQYGRWTLLDKHTSEPHLGTIIHDEYLLWGKLTSLVKLNPIISYHLFRFSMGAILLFVIYLFLKKLFPNSAKTRVLSFLFILFSFGFPKISQTASGTTVEQYMVWLTELDIFARFVALPHYLIGNIFFLSNVIAFLSISKRTQLKYFIICLSSVFMALIHPVSVVSLCAYYAVYLFLSTIIKFSVGARRDSPVFNKQEIIGFLITVFSAAPILLFYKYLMTIPPWNHMAAWEGVSKYNIPLKEYIGAIGPNTLLAPIGFLFMIKDAISKKFGAANVFLSAQPDPACGSEHCKKMFANQTFLNAPIFLLSWILSFFLLIFYSYPFLKISEVRLMQVFIFIPFAILSAYAVISVGALLRVRPKNNLFIILTILILFLISSPLYIKSFQTKIFYYPTNSMLAFPPIEWMKGEYYLRDNTPKESVVLAAYMGATTIPFVSGNTVYTGHTWATLDRTRKEALKEKFFRNQMTDSEALNFLKTEKIDYVFNGYQESSMGSHPEKYKFLKPVFSSSMVIIYKFEK